MRKTFMGVRLRALREQRGLTQAALAQRLDLSPSYVNQLENNQRPLSVPVLLKLQAALGIDLQCFSEDEEARLIAQLQEATADVEPGAPIAPTELQALAQQMPALARRMIELHRRARDASERLETVASRLGDRDMLSGVAATQPHEEVREFFYARHNYIAELDALAEDLHGQLRPGSALAGDLAPALERLLRQRHGVSVHTAAPGHDGGALRRYDPVGHSLQLHPELEPGQRSFQLGVQLAFLEAGDLLTRLVASEPFHSQEARELTRIGLAGYFAGALVLPYSPFLRAAESLSYDIELLARRFGVSFETVCHRLSTLQRPDAPGVPFFFIRIDRAGNISKRQSATDFHFSRMGGACPLWNVYEAFSRPGRVLTQLAAMPDGRTYLWIARSIQSPPEGFGLPIREFAVALGCDRRHASRLVYARGLVLDDPEAATPIGPGCKVCERPACAQRALPALGRELRISEYERPLGPYAGREPNQA